MRAVVDSGWLAEHLGEDDLVVGDVRGPNAHMRGHIPGSRPLVLGSPPPAADEESARALAHEIALRLRRHGITGRERLVLVDRGDGMGAMPAAQMAELAGHPQRRGPPRRHRRLGGRPRGGSGRARACAGGGGRPRGESAGIPDAAGACEPARRCDVDDPRRADAGGVHGPPRQPVRSAPGAHPGRAEPRRRRAVRGAGTPCFARAGPRARRPARGDRDRRVLPLRLSLGARDSRAPLWPATTRATTPAPGTSGAGTTSCRSSASRSTSQA